MSEPVRPLLRVDAVAAMIAVSRSTVYRWIDGGYLPAIDLPGRGKRLDPASVVRFLRDAGDTQAAERVAVACRPNPQ